MSEIQGLIRQIARGGDFTSMYAVEAIVKSVDIFNDPFVCTCSPVNGDSDLVDIRLKADDGNSLVIVPQIGSLVIVVLTSQTTGFVGMFSQVESIKFLDGAFGGLVKVADLITKLNNLENKVNAIITWGGTVSPPLATLPLTTTVRADIENTEITHGSI